MRRFEVYVILCVGACMFASFGLLNKIIGLPDGCSLFSCTCLFVVAILTFLKPVR